MASNELQLLETTDYSRWDALVACSPQGTVFSSSRFLQSLGAPFRLYEITDGKKPLALLSAVEDASRRKMLRYDYTPHQGVLFLHDVHVSTRQRILDEYRIGEFVAVELTRRYAEIGMFLSWEFTDVRPFLWHNYHEPQLGRYGAAPRYTAVLDLVDIEIESYPAQTRACRRQELRKAMAYNVTESSDLDLFLQLYGETFARQDIALSEHTLALVRSITAAALEHGYGRLSSCETPQGTASMNLFLYDAKRAYYMFAANNPELRATGAATRLMFDNIFEAKRRGLRELDFVGVNSPNRGDFKLSFNPELKLYFDIQYVPPVQSERI